MIFIYSLFWSDEKRVRNFTEPIMLELIWFYHTKEEADLGECVR